MKQLTFSLLLLAGAIFTSLWSHNYLRNFSEYRPLIPDIIHNQLPSIPDFGYVADLIVIFDLIILGFLFSQNKEKIPYYLSLIASIYFVRAILITLNPVGDSFINSGYYGLFPGSDLSQGMFPSGHTAIAFLVFLLTEKKSNFKLSTLILLILEIFALLISKGHYSIDIVGGILLTYTLYRVFEDRKNYFTKKQY